MSDSNFPTADVLGAGTGYLIGPVDGIYAVCTHAAGEDVYTHQLPRVGRELRDALLARYPWFQTVVDEAAQITGENWQEWRDRWVERYGAELAVPRLSEDQHERIDPLSELAEKIHPSRIVTVPSPAPPATGEAQS